MRRVKNGPLVAAEIRCENGRFSALVNGKPLGSAHEDPLRATGVASIYLGQRISEAEYQRRLRELDDPNHPSHRPHQPVVLTDLPPII